MKYNIINIFKENAAKYEVGDILTSKNATFIIYMKNGKKLAKNTNNI